MEELVTTVVVLASGSLLARVLGQLPSVDWLSGWAAAGTIALTFLLGYSNVAIGDVVGRVMAPDCVGWDVYSSTVSRLGDRYELVLPRTHPASPADSRVLADDTRGISHDLGQLTPPAAAERFHENLLAVFSTTETQLLHHAAGQDFDRTTLNALLDQQSLHSATANRACR